MKTLTCLLSLALASTAFGEDPVLKVNGVKLNRDSLEVQEALKKPIALGPGADAFNEALHLEEVARDLDRAAAKYLTLARESRTRNDDKASGAAALSLFRVAEIRRRQGRDDEARQLYAKVLEDFSDWEPMASLSRQQLGIDPSAFLPQLTRIENDRTLSINVVRNTWEVRTRVCDDEFVLVTFQVEPNKKSKFKGLPEEQEIQTLYYLPQGPLTSVISTTRFDDGIVGNGSIGGEPAVGTLGTRLSCFEHTFDVPPGLRQNVVSWDVASGWIGFRESSHDVKMWWNFEDDHGENLQVLKVNLIASTISEAKARELLDSRSLSLPKLDKKRWSLTLPPAPVEFEKAYRGE